MSAFGAWSITSCGVTSPGMRNYLKEHAEIILKYLKPLERKSPELSAGFRKRLEELLQASKGVEVCSGYIYTVYAEKG